MTPKQTQLIENNYNLIKLLKKTLDEHQKAILRLLDQNNMQAKEILGLKIRLDAHDCILAGECQHDFN